MFSNKYDFLNQLDYSALSSHGKKYALCSKREKYYALANLIANNTRELAGESYIKSTSNNQKRVFYFSMEFLIGKLLENTLIYLGETDLVKEALEECGDSLTELCEIENDAGLGNGGLGRLAACFIDSLASLGYAGYGNGIRYRYGLFKQEIVDGKQVEKPDEWLSHGYPWERKRPENTVIVRFGGQVIRHYNNDKVTFEWTNAEKVKAVPYDIPVVGYNGTVVNNLRLWSAEPYEEHFDMDAFNRGDYASATKYRSEIEAITSILYPNDNADPGKVLRLKQEYLFVAAGLATIIKNYKQDFGNDFRDFPNHIAIHTNDTHPSLCAPELMRILIDEENLSWDEAWDIVTKTISYTNHTILPEASEKWPIEMFRTLLPRVYDFVEEIDRRYREGFPKDITNWRDVLKNTAILWDGQVKMANLSIIAGHSVNGVAALHTEILKNRVLKDFYTVFPKRFNNKTNGISQRRFLLQANPSYSNLITKTIGDKWITKADELEKLEQFSNNEAFLEESFRAKKENKYRLAKYIQDTTGVLIDPSSIFDIQVKRFHAYKRQTLNIFKIIEIYNEILDSFNYQMHPVTFIFSGKAAQGYEFAKENIRLIHSIADKINSEPRIKDMIKVAFIPNFSVSNAQLIYPAADISEQISTAGYEASGTGNMKFMLNGAITLGTLDGSTVEIAEKVGKDNIKLFGLSSEEIENAKLMGTYNAWDEYHKDIRIKEIIDSLSSNFRIVTDNIMRGNDEYFVLKDFDDYLTKWKELINTYSDKITWRKMSLINTAKSGFFSSDRAINEYAKDIWGIT